MRTLAATLFAAALAVVLTPPFLLPKAEGAWIIRKVSVAAPSYLIDEDFAETGSPTGATWTDTGTPDYDSTTHSTLSGEALRIDSAEQAYTTYTANSTIWAACKMEVPTGAVPGSTTSFWGIRSSAGGAHALLRIGVGGTGKVALFCAGADTTASSTFTISANTLYYVWIKYVDGGTCELYISTTSTKPSMSTDSATQFSTSATDDTSGDAARVDFRGALLSPAVYYDDVFVSTSEIGNPW